MKELLNLNNCFKFFYFIYIKNIFAYINYYSYIYINIIFYLYIINNYISFLDDYKNNNKLNFINNFELKENFQYLFFTDSILSLNIIKEYLKQNENFIIKIVYIINNQTDNNKLKIIKNENKENVSIFRIIIEITELINLYIKFLNYLFINNKENDYILNYFIFNDINKNSIIKIIIILKKLEEIYLSDKFLYKNKFGQNLNEYDAIISSNIN